MAICFERGGVQECSGVGNSKSRLSKRVKGRSRIKSLSTEDGSGS